ncbi:PhoH family protein [Alphaproteobacteria bacterium]|jgi:phosphate starvation-inducible PhoH-like protein|nr:PhoH family protein [Alphaproteobacteria bacterium]MDA8710703.1 PhoH family protein [Alphaproteobacteria bacterium]MDB0031882.1 PhoH family protein [Alphaproteobacteria bacterium]MDB0034505.1 PhoH family protein [Alphaproteobacteria bacterium]MDB2371742.1 PhoH family protein [Alphaproteobacteria bacterium]
MTTSGIPLHQKKLEFEDNQFLISLFGYHDKNLKVLEDKFKVQLYTRGNLLSIKGNRDPVEKAYFIIQGLYQKLKNKDITPEEIENNIDLAKPSYIKEQIEQDQKFQITTKLKTIYPKTKNQEIFLKQMKTKDIVFAVGPAGTGKTYMAVAYAVSLFVEGKINRLVLSRPAVEAGERLGFLPGDMKEKIDPYLRPLYDALYEMMPGEEIDRKMVNNLIEIAPLAFMRGRTLNKSFIILDEAQNTLSTQMKMFLTRLGQDSKMIITGDLSQKDLPDNAKSGMQDAMEKLEKVKDIGFVHLNSSDVCRHSLVEKIINAYEK